jgi:DNA-binding response OmpR family regulator
MDDAPTTGFSKSILLVDDDQFIAVAYKDGLERAGYQLYVAHDGKEAEEILKSRTPDLILLDLIMPKMNGFELLQVIKADKNLKDVPVLVLTNLSQDSDKEEAMSYGVVDVMVKTDVSLKDLVTRINSLLGQNPQG